MLCRPSTSRPRTATRRQTPPCASSGATVFVPPRVAHTFANRSAGAARFLLTTPPSGHDRYFEELAAILSVEGAPNPQAIAELRRRYDTEQIETLVAS